MSDIERVGKQRTKNWTVATTNDHLTFLGVKVEIHSIRQ